VLVLVPLLTPQVVVPVLAPSGRVGADGLDMAAMDVSLPRRGFPLPSTDTFKHREDRATGASHATSDSAMTA
jgi:hypothetical protein